MKKIIGFLSLAALITVMSCTEKKTEVQKEIIVVPAAPTVIVKDPPPPPPAPKSTTITFDKNGVKVETKKDNK